MTNPRSGRAPSAHSGGPGAATSVVAGVLALPLAAMLACVPVKTFLDYGLDVARGQFRWILGAYLAASVVLLLGAALLLFRRIAGAVLLLIGALLALVAVLLEPTLLGHGQYGRYFEAVFALDRWDAWIRAAGLVLAPLTFLFAVLPPTFRYLSHERPAHARGRLGSGTGG